MIFYFSATGNSYYAAKKLAEATNDTLYSIPDCVKAGKSTFEVTRGENIGIVCPTYFFGLPAIVHSFLCSLMLTNAEESYFYALFTCGSETGNIVKQYTSLMKIKVVPVHAIFDLPMVDNYVTMFEVASPEEIEQKLNAADAALTDIIAKIRRKEVGFFNTHKGKFAGLKTGILYPRYATGRRTKKFTVSPSCIGCGRCAKFCPVGAITMRDDMVPIWIIDQCSLCLGCVNGCPAHAIQYGKGTKKHGRYMNPRITLPEPDPSQYMEHTEQDSSALPEDAN
ncbi:MAG: EFR1 family ferrodoxin [Oscillospiraceae bacterium]|jgi:ferredoxin